MENWVAPGLDEFDVLLEVVLSLVRVRQSIINTFWLTWVFSGCSKPFYWVWGFNSQNLIVIKTPKDWEGITLFKSNFEAF